MEQRLRSYTLHPYSWVQNLKVSQAVEPSATRFSFVRSDEKIATENELFLLRDLLPNRYVVKLASKTSRGTIMSRDEADVRHTASFIRSLTLQYSYEPKA